MADADGTHHVVRADRRRAARPGGGRGAGPVPAHGPPRRQPDVAGGPAPELAELLDLAGLREEVTGQAGPEPSSGRCGGRPNAGKIRSVSRKNVMRLIRPPDTSFTCSAQGWWPPAGSGLYWAQAGKPLTSQAGTMIESRQALGDGSCIQRMMSGAPDPEGIRRHRHQRVVVQQRDQLVHVVPLERVHVLGEQLGLVRVDRRRALLLGQRGQRGPGPLQRAVHRGHAGAQGVRRLGRGHLQHLAHDQGGPLPRRQVLQRGDERQPDACPGPPRSRPGRRAPA